MISTVKAILKKILPSFIKNWLESIFFYFQLRGIRYNQKKALKRARRKATIKVAFLLIHDAVWKYEGIYGLMAADKRFEPVVIVCPFTTFGDETMLREMNRAYENFKGRGFNVVKFLNETTGTRVNIKKEIQPDIVFFTNPHFITTEEYYFTNYLDCLTCYVPYNFGNSHLYEMMYNQLFHNSLWRLFAETEIHKGYSVKFAFNKGRNVIVTGFPGTDIFLDRNYIPPDIWKQGKNKRKRIIWAPHHSIDNDKSLVSYSTFLMFHDFMIELAEEYKDNIQIAFKPHPLLADRLYIEEGWGKKRTDSYYAKWDDIENGQLALGDYIDLFLTSDSMMHDSGSYLIEYLYTGKPVLHLDRDENITDRMNDFGVLAYKQHYHAKNREEIRAFIESLLNDQDVKKEERKEFLTSHLLPPNHKSASENVYSEVVKQVFEYSND